MPNPFLGATALFSVHLGFSALFGYWLNRAMNTSSWRYQSLPMLIFAILLVAANWTAPLGLAGKVLLALLSTTTVLTAVFRYDALRIHPDWVWLYTAFSMAAILLWSILQSQALLAISMSLLAFGACILALQRGSQSLID